MPSICIARIARLLSLEFDVKRNKLEDEKVAEELKCVLECCKYPRTCDWNKRCMEEGMRMSKDAEMVREQDIRRETDGDTKK